MTVAICIPARDEMKTRCALDLAALLVHERHRDILPPLARVGAMGQEQRELQAEDAQASGAEHILWIDSDSRFPQETLSLLLARQKPLIGAGFRARRPPHDWNVFLPGGLRVGPQGRFGVECVSGLGFGLVLMTRTVLASVSPPRFMTPWSQRDRRYVDEGTYFCAMLEPKGVPVHVDWDLTRDVGHLAEFEVTAAWPPENSP